MVECILRWIKKHNVVVYGSTETRKLLDYFRVDTGFVRINQPNTDLMRMTLQAFRNIRRIQPSDGDIIVSGSDLPHDVLAGYRLQKNNPRAAWVSCFFLIAPPLHHLLLGKPVPSVLYTLYGPLQQQMIRIMKRCDLIITAAPYERSKLHERGVCPSKTFNIKGGVDLSTADKVQDQPKRYDAVFIGRLHPQKGALDLIDIWSRVVHDFSRPDMKLAVIGSGPQEDQMKRKIAQRGLQDNILMLGFMDGREKFRIIKSSRMVLHPVRVSGGMAAAEALVCGVPGVCFNLPDLQGYYDSGFLKAEPENNHDFAEKIVVLASQPDLHERLRQEALGLRKEWNWDNQAEILLAKLADVRDKRISNGCAI